MSFKSISCLPFVCLAKKKNGLSGNASCPSDSRRWHTLELTEVDESHSIEACLSSQGRLNELMSQIRMQNHFGAVRAEERYYIDADLLREIKQVSITR